MFSYNYRGEVGQNVDVLGKREDTDIYSQMYLIHTCSFYFLFVSDRCMHAGVLTHFTACGLTSCQRLTLGCLSESFFYQGPSEAIANELEVLVTG